MYVTNTNPKTRLLGRVFGKLTVLSFSHVGKRVYYWNCKCECGSLTVVGTSSLSTGHSKSCGKCYNGNSLIGKRFGKLTVISYAGSSKSGSSQWVCLCDCGKEVIKRKANLKDNVVCSCGCYVKHRAKTLTKSTKEAHTNESKYKNIIKIYQRNAEKRSISFCLTLEQVKYIVNQNCHYCQSEPSNRIKYKDTVLYYNGIDRVDSGSGYILSNIVPCCSVCNIAKQKMSTSEFTNWIERVYNNLITTRKIKNDLLQDL